MVEASLARPVECPSTPSGEGDRLNSAGPGDNYSSSADRESTEGAVIFPAEKGVAPTQGELSKARTECRLLKGTSAEEKGMWVCGMNVIIDVLSASIYVNPVLLNDFECAGGYKLLVHMLLIFSDAFHEWPYWSHTFAL